MKLHIIWKTSLLYLGPPQYFIQIMEGKCNIQFSSGCEQQYNEPNCILYLLSFFYREFVNRVIASLLLLWPECKVGFFYDLIKSDCGGFQLLNLIITELKSHMTCWKFKVSHWWKFYLSKKSFTRFALQSECCYFNQWEALNYNRSCDF